jgi:hypothetical protein
VTENMMKTVSKSFEAFTMGQIYEFLTKIFSKNWNGANTNFLQERSGDSSKSFEGCWLTLAGIKT